LYIGVFLRQSKEERLKGFKSAGRRRDTLVPVFRDPVRFAQARPAAPPAGGIGTSSSQ
jgi:hypothetical protein